VFLPQVRSAGQVVHTDVPEARNVNTLFFMFERDTLCRTSVFASKMICGSRNVFRCNRGVKRRITIFHSRVRPVQIQQKAHWDMLCTTFVFVSGGICVSHSAFQCVRGVKHRCTIFHSRVGLVRIPQKVRWNMLRRTCVFAFEGSAGHVVHSAVSGARNIGAQFFTFG
jgi:hypothetical protein